jgi:hypothetical protein
MSMNDPSQYQNIDPQMLQMFIANAIGPKKQGVTQSDISPIQDIIMSQMLGMPVNKPVNEDLIRSVNAPQWSAMANYAYTDTDIEPKIMQLIEQGIPLTEVKKKIKEELALQGLPTDSKNEQVKNLLKLSDTLYGEFTNSNSKILEAKQASLTNSPYTKFGVSDPNDYNKIDDASLAALGGPDAAGSVAQTLGLNQIAPPTAPIDSIYEGFKKKPPKPTWQEQEIAMLLKLPQSKSRDDQLKAVMAWKARIDAKAAKPPKPTRQEQEIAMLLKLPQSKSRDDKLKAERQWKANIDAKEARNKPALEYKPRTQQEAQLFGLVNESNQNDLMSNPTIMAFNKMNANKSANIAQMVAENRRQQIDTNSANTASNKSNQDIMKKLVLMKVMGNPKLLANPAIQQVLGS